MGIGRRTRLAAMAALATLALAGPGCEEAEPTDLSWDRDLDPEQLAELEGKMDAATACRGETGGSLEGDDLLVIVNKEEARQLSADWEPDDLVAIAANRMMPGREGLARRAAVEAFDELAAAAATEAGLDLRVRSAYRSFETQCYTFNYWVEENGYDHAVRYSARPGRSEHQLGTALDITAASVGWALSARLASTPEGAWLMVNAHRFGFALSYPEGQEAATGYGYEPWHWRYLGRDAAAERDATGIWGYEYLSRCDRGDAALACPHEPPPVVVPNEGFIGGACSDAAACTALEPDALCLLDGYPGGLCSLPCERTCPDLEGDNAGTFCVEDSPGAATGHCHSKCDTELFPGPDGGCREGYACHQASRPNAAGTAFVCLPSE